MYRLRKFVLTGMFSLCFLSILAQDQTEPEDEKVLENILSWLQIYSYSNDDAFYDLRSDFKSTSFVNTYLTSSIESEKWLFLKLNEVAGLRHTEKNTPQISFRLIFSPSENTYQEAYRIRSECTTSIHSLSTEEIDKVFNDQLPSGYTGLSDITTRLSYGLDAALQYVSDQVKDEYVPAIRIRVTDSDAIYLDGETIELYSGESTIEIQALDKTGTILSNSEVTWEGASPHGNYAIVDLRTQPEKEVKIKSKWGNMSVQVQMAGSDRDWKELLKTLIVEVLEKEKTLAITRLDSLSKDSSSLYGEIDMLKKEFERENIPTQRLEGFQSQGMFVILSDNQLLSGEEKGKFLNNQDLAESARTFQKYLLVRKSTTLELNRIALAEMLIDQPEKMSTFTNSLIRNSGHLLARLLLGRDATGNRDAARNIIIQFVNIELRNNLRGSW